MNRFISCFAAIGIVSLGLSGCGQSKVAETEPKPVGDRVVASAPVRKELTLYTTQPGQIEAYESTPLYSKIAGYVENIAVDIGDSVKKGDVLVKLSVPEMQDDLEQNGALVAQAESEINQAEAAISAAQAEVQTSEAKKEQALAGVDAAAAVRMRWQSERNRIVELVAGGSVTPKLADETESQFRGAEASWKQAKAAVTATEAALAQAKVNVTKAEADRDAVKSHLRVAKANLARTTTMFTYTEIKAPFDGVVTRREVDTGHFVQPASGVSAKPLLVVARMDKVRIFVDIPETEAALVQGGSQGDTAVVRVQALRDREFTAKVERTGWSLDSSNRSLRVELDVLNEDGLLRPGMYAMATILLDKRENTLTLPATAVTRKGNEFFCCRVDAGVIRRQRIQVGIRCGEDVEVASGIEDSNLVVLARTESLVDGQTVEVAAPE